jgi:hypothetical protein
VQATLPHSDPGKVEGWSRSNGNLTLTIRPGWDHNKRRSLGYPYGTIPRLLLFWITTEALRTRNRRLYLGNSIAAFMRELGLDPSRGGPRSDAWRLRDQMMRLFRAIISFDRSDERKHEWLDMQIAPEGCTCFWWDSMIRDRTTFSRAGSTSTSDSSMRSQAHLYPWTCGRCGH